MGWWRSWQHGDPTPRRDTSLLDSPRRMLPAMIPVLTLLFPAAHALGLDPTLPPVRVDASHWRFDDVVLEVHPAVVLHLAPGVQPPADAHSLGGRSHRIPVQSAEAAVARALALDGLAGHSAFPDVVLHRAPAAITNDPERPGQWYLDELNMDALHAVSMGDPAIRVAVIDSGIDIGHPDLAAAVLDPYDAHADDSDPSPNPGEYCYGGSTTEICDEHGTAVSGVIAARGDNAVGIVGMCPQCTLIPIKMLGEDTGALSADIAAFEHAIAADAAVINNSWGYTRVVTVPEPLAEVIHVAATETRGGLGSLVVFAAGNDDREIEDRELQALADVVCVSATDSYGYPTNYTNYGASVAVAAPSATVSIAPEEGMTTTFGGTSAAAPVVSGLAAWALSVDPTLSASALRQLLLDTAVPSPLVTHDADGHHDYYGYGQLSAEGVMAALQDGGGDSGDAPDDNTDPDAIVDNDDEGKEGRSGCATGATGLAGGWWGLLALSGLAARRRSAGR